LIYIATSILSQIFLLPERDEESE